jgi:sterol desaturase/sphingolipid hydroxylase (fatty acid hydroxylase superfamily)
MANHFPVSKADESVRLFESDFLEFFSHISPVTVTVIWLPVALFFLIWAIIHPDPASSAIYIPLCFLFGLFFWTFAEYNLHRFLFHFEAKSERGQKIFYLFHGVHHAYPQDKTRLVMPPAVSIPLAIVAYGLFYLVIAVVLKVPYWVFPTFSGFILGYLTYDLIHYATHHFPMRNGYFKFIKRYHMQHHYKTPQQRFGVSSPLWDYVYKTYPAD